MVDAARDTSETPLYFAALNGHLAVFNALIAQGANVHAANVSGTALYMALHENHTEVAIALIHAGCNITKDDVDMALKINNPDLSKLIEIKLLEAYIANRGAEHAPEYKTKAGKYVDKLFNLFSKEADKTYPRSKNAKVAAARARLRELQGGDSAMTKEELDASKSGDLKKIVRKSTRKS